MKRNKLFFALVITLCLMLNALPLSAKSDSEIPINYKECEDALTQREIENGFSDVAIMEKLEETFGKKQDGENSIYYVGSPFQMGNVRYINNILSYLPTADEAYRLVWNENGELIGVLSLSKYYDYVKKEYYCLLLYTSGSKKYNGNYIESDIIKFPEIAEDSKNYALVGLPSFGLGGYSYCGYVLIDEEDNMTILSGSLYDEENLRICETDKAFAEKVVEEMTFEKYSFGKNVISKDMFILDKSTALEINFNKIIDITLAAGVEEPLPPFLQ